MILHASSLQNGRRSDWSAARFMCLLNLRDEDSGVLTVVGEDVHAVNVSGPSLPMPAPARDPRCLFCRDSSPRQARPAPLSRSPFLRGCAPPARSRTFFRVPYRSPFPMPPWPPVTTVIVFFMCDLPDLDTAQAALYGPPVLCFRLYSFRSTSSRRRI